jgi:hypothetical protein
MGYVSSLVRCCSTPHKPNTITQRTARSSTSGPPADSVSTAALRKRGPLRPVCVQLWCWCLLVWVLARLHACMDACGHESARDKTDTDLSMEQSYHVQHNDNDAGEHSMPLSCMLRRPSSWQTQCACTPAAFDASMHVKAAAIRQLSVRSAAASCTKYGKTSIRFSPLRGGGGSGATLVAPCVLAPPGSRDSTGTTNAAAAAKVIGFRVIRGPRDPGTCGTGRVLQHGSSGRRLCGINIARRLATDIAGAATSVIPAFPQNMQGVTGTHGSGRGCAAADGHWHTQVQCTTTTKAACKRRHGDVKMYYSRNPTS